jgi:signal transduction histidine kinase
LHRASLGSARVLFLVGTVFWPPRSVHVLERQLGDTAHCSERATATQFKKVFCGANGDGQILKSDHHAVVATGRASKPAPEWVEELLRRATALALGSPQRGPATSLPSELARRLDSAEERAATIAVAAGGCEEGRRAAALEFVAEVVVSRVVENAVKPGEVRKVVADVGAVIGVSPGAASLTVFLRAIAARDVAQLPPRLAMDFLLDLLLELGPVEAVSLWTVPAPGRLLCAASAGAAPRSRRLRTAARTAFSVPIESACVRSVVVDRWDKPFAALVARCRPEASARLLVYLRELATALTPLFERDMLYERHAARERQLVSGGERRLVRLGFDLHDGPLQELVALADDLRHARDQVASVLGVPHQSVVRGRFDDLEARLGSLDQGLRDIAHSVRATSAVEQPLEHALRNEVDALERVANIQVELAVDGDIASLTDSQKIALFRVVQESISNIRKHSGATQARVRVRAVAGYVSLEVVDNGCGFALEEARAKGRLGLAGVVERIRLLGGDVEIESSPDNGVLVRATLPRWRPAVQSATPVYAVTA